MRKLTALMVLLGCGFLIVQLHAAESDCSLMTNDIDTRTKLQEVLACMTQAIKDLQISRSRQTATSPANIPLPFFKERENRTIPGSAGAAFCAIAEIKTPPSAEGWCLIDYQNKTWMYNTSPEATKCSARCFWLTFR